MTTTIGLERNSGHGSGDEPVQVSWSAGQAEVGTSEISGPASHAAACAPPLQPDRCRFPGCQSQGTVGRCVVCDERVCGKHVPKHGGFVVLDGNTHA
jgi:hypothetical protein